MGFVFSKDENCRSHTGLSLGEFAYLLELYKIEYEEHMIMLYEKKN
jgi:hypothetical protein